MGRMRVVDTTKVDRIPISDGDWVEVKHELNTGDQKRLESAGLKAPVMLNGIPINPIDWATHDQSRALIFLTDWSLCDPDDKRLPVNFSTINSLDVETFEEINRAIKEHIFKVAAEKKAKREAELKAKAEAQATAQAATPTTTEAQPLPATNSPSESESASVATSTS